jgi:hypothetical protein
MGGGVEAQAKCSPHSLMRPWVIWLHRHERHRTAERKDVSLSSSRDRLTGVKRSPVMKRYVSTAEPKKLATEYERFEGLTHPNRLAA